MEDVNAYMEIIKENIEYEHHMKYGRWQDKGLYEELYEVICEIVCVKHKTVKIGGNDYPYELVKLSVDNLHNLWIQVFIITLFASSYMASKLYLVLSESEVPYFRFITGFSGNPGNFLENI